MTSSTASLAGSLRLTKCDRLRAATKKAVKAGKKFFRKIFRCKAKKPRISFVMPHEYAAMHRSTSWRTVSSIRSRRSAVTVRNGHPSIFVIRPTTRRAKHLTFSIHQGPGTPTVDEPQVSPHIRFIHPTVDAVIPTPPTPNSMTTTRSSFKSSDSWETIDDDSSALTVEPSPTVSEFAGQVNPKLIHRHSQVINGELTFQQTLAVMDGTLKQSDRDTLPSQARIVRAQVIEVTRLAPAPARQLSVEKTPSPFSTENLDEARKAAERALTLKALDGRTSLVVSASTETRPRTVRPYTDPSLPYVAYGLPFNPYNDSQQRATIANASTAEASVLPPSSCNKGKRAADPKVQYATERARAANDPHRLLYDRVESGVFNSPILPPAPHPASPTPARRSAYPPTEQQIKRKSVPKKEPRQPHLSKPLPASPGPNSPRRLTPPTRFLNDNGYPILTGSAAVHAVEQRYERRSLHPEEAKRIRDDAKKAAKMAAKKQNVARQEDKEINKELQRLIF